jgi:excisionase family DNA binding protein
MQKKAKASKVRADGMRLFDNPRQLLTVKQVAEALNLSIYTVYRKIQSGALEARRGGDGGTIRVPAFSVEAYMQPACSDAGRRA